jgi:hypothetical protein
VLRADSVAPAAEPAPADANVFYAAKGNRRFAAGLRTRNGEAGSPVRFVFAGDAAALAGHPSRYRFRYEVP